jgi:hypothetical protein
VPADAFYEWRVVEGGKAAIARQDGQPRAFDGLWESFRWPDETVTRSFTILTTAPNAEMSELHDRMPAPPGRVCFAVPREPRAGCLAGDPCSGTAAAAAATHHPPALAGPRCKRRPWPR